MFRKLLFVLIINTFAFAQVTISSKIDTSIATVGDRIKLSVSVTYTDHNTTLTFPNLNDELQNFSIIEQKSNEPENIATGFQQDFNFTIAVFDTGIIEIPPLTIAINGEHYADTKTKKHRLNVISILPPDEQVDPKDIKPPFPLPKIIPWDIALFMLIIITLAVIWFFVYRKWKKQKKLALYDEKYIDPPHIIALKKLKAVATLSVNSETEIISVYTQISHIFREYLEGRFFIRALEMPTREIMSSLELIDIDITLQTQIVDILQKLDIIKFAKQLPETSEKDNIIEASISIINKTKIDNFLSQRSGLTDAKESLGK